MDLPHIEKERERQREREKTNKTTKAVTMANGRTTGPSDADLRELLTRNSNITQDKCSADIQKGKTAPLTTVTCDTHRIASTYLTADYSKPQSHVIS